MKLATFSNPGSRDGSLIVVSHDNRRCVRVDPGIAPSLIAALRDWTKIAPELEAIYSKLNKGTHPDARDLELDECIAPLPQAPGFYDGSAFLSHVVRARRSQGDQMPESAKKTPLMYQGVSDNLLPWNAPMDLMEPGFGGDFEGEFAVITTDVPKGIPAEKAGPFFALFTLFNDITYREIVKTEIETKFGFLQSKPNSAFAPFVVTASELGDAWDGKRIALDVEVHLNGQLFGKPNGKEMHFSLGELVAHAARTRPLSAGSIVGTGTVSNEDKGRGFACLTEKRFQEIIDEGKPLTPWLKTGDRVHIDVKRQGQSVFGVIDEVAVL